MEAVKPQPDRPSEGFLQLNVDFATGAAPSEASRFVILVNKRPFSLWPPIRTPLELVHLGRMIERAVRDSRAVDTEELCIEPGVSVWNLRVDAHILDDDGNVGDAAAMASMIALAHFRRPVTTVVDGRVVFVRGNMH